MRFTKLSLRNWRNFRGVDVDLKGRVFLVGPNASGKSNLLDVFRFLSDIASPTDGGLQGAVHRRGGVSALRCLSARRQTEILVRVEIGSGANGPKWSYELAISNDSKGRPEVRWEVVLAAGVRVLERPNRNDKLDRVRLSQTHLEQVSENKDFREISEFFQSVRYKHIVPQLVRDPDRSVGRRDDPYGGDFLEQIARTNKQTQGTRLKRIERALRSAVPQLKEFKLERDDRGRPHLHCKYEHWRKPGAWQTEDLLSDGTIRLIGFLWAVLDGEGPLLLEEPEMSLHPGLVRFIPRLLARARRGSERQVLVSTHSSDMLYDPGIGLDEVLVLKPGAEGSTVTPASRLQDVRCLLEAKVPLAEALLPQTEPEHLEQLALFEA